MKTFASSNKLPELFLTEFNAALEGRELGKMVEVTMEKNKLTVTIKKLGTSEMFFEVTIKENGFEAHKTSEKISFAHKPFRAELEGKLARVMEGLGAKVSF